jgi:hypothetical protein
MSLSLLSLTNFRLQKDKELEQFYGARLKESQVYPLRKTFSIVQQNEEDIAIARLLRVRANLPLDVLDLGCGKGGDIGKWLKCKKGNRLHVFYAVLPAVLILLFVSLLLALGYRSSAVCRS